MGDWITIVNRDTFEGISDSEIAILTTEQRKLLDEGADPDDDELRDLEVYPIEDLLKWAIVNGYFDPHLKNAPLIKMNELAGKQSSQGTSPGPFLLQFVAIFPSRHPRQLC
jgi:hypothetical protein